MALATLAINFKMMNEIMLILSNVNNIKMATKLIMIGGAIINATAFVGGNYLANHLSGDSAGEEKKRHDLAVERYERAYQKYQEKRTKLLDWIASQDRTKDEAKKNFENTDYALKLYNETHQDRMDLREPRFSDFYKLNVRQKQGEILYVGASALAIVLAASHFL